MLWLISADLNIMPLKGPVHGINRKQCISHISSSASASSRALARRKLVRNRFTIDTDLIFHGNNNNSSNDSDPSQPYWPQHALLQSLKPQGEDTDRWVEEQFDLHHYEDQGEGIDVGQVKETDILSDDDEYCKSVRAASAEPARLDGEMEGLSIQGAEYRIHKLNRQLQAGREVRQNVTREEEAESINVAGHSDSVDSFSSCGLSVSHCATSNIKHAKLKQCAVEGATNKDRNVIWVRRDDFANACKSDVF